jgi:hypothetical protein
MAEYTYNAQQTVALNSPIIFNNSIPCTCGLVFHETDTGIFILKGISNGRYTRYVITFGGNIQIPEGTVGPIAVSISVNGEERPASKAIYTPPAVEAFGSVVSTAIVTVPRGCCFTVGVRYVDGAAEDAATTPPPSIVVQNANLTIYRVQ